MRWNMSGSQCGGLCQVEVLLTILKTADTTTIHHHQTNRSEYSVRPGIINYPRLWCCLWLDYLKIRLPWLPGSGIKASVVMGVFHSSIWSHQLCIGLKLGCDNNSDLLERKLSRTEYWTEYSISIWTVSTVYFNKNNEVVEILFFIF